MDSSPLLKFTDLLSSHGENCSDEMCILPQCVNWKLKLAKSSNKPPNHIKSNRSPIGCHDGKCANEEFPCKVETSGETAVLKQLVEDLMELEDIDFPSCFEESFSDKASQDGFPEFNKDGFPISWNPQRDQHQLPIEVTTNNGEVRMPCRVGQGMRSEVPLQSNTCVRKGHGVAQFPDKTEMLITARMKSQRQEIGGDKPTGNYLELGSLAPELETFIPIDVYLNPSGMTENTAAENGEKKPCPKEREPIEEAAKAKHSNIKKLFGILAEILGLFEGHHFSEDLEAFSVEVLQRALAELRGAIRSL